MFFFKTQQEFVMVLQKNEEDRAAVSKAFEQLLSTAHMRICTHALFAWIIERPEAMFNQWETFEEYMFSLMC